MPLNQAKYSVDIIEGIRCRVIESTPDETRMQFLNELLLLNGYEVKVDRDAEGRFRIGVTDVTFNPVIAVYERKLKSKTGHWVTPAYWLQISGRETETETNYWLKPDSALETKRRSS
jgi:hypothetical protein